MKCDQIRALKAQLNDSREMLHQANVTNAALIREHAKLLALVDGLSRFVEMSNGCPDDADIEVESTSKT